MITARLRAGLPSSEHQLQSHLVEFLEIAKRDDVLYTAIGNGGKRHIRTAVRLKAEGLKAGAPDMLFVLPHGRCAFLEMKTKRGSLSPAQREWRDVITGNGHLWALCRTLDEAKAFLAAIGALKAGTY